MKFNVQYTYQHKMFYRIFLTQVTKFSFHWTCTVTHISICICSDIELWVSGHIPEVKNNRKIQIARVESSRYRLQELSTIMISLDNKHMYSSNITANFFQKGKEEGVGTCVRDLGLSENQASLPGATVLTQMPFCDKSRAIGSIIPTIAPFEAQ